MDLSDPARAVMTPSVSAVLRVLVRASPAEFTLREVARLAGVSHNSAQTVVHRLADHGLVTVRPAGRALLCGFNSEHLAADAVAALVTLRSRLVQALAEELSGWSPPPTHASLFGSAARGDADLTVIWTFSWSVLICPMLRPRGPGMPNLASPWPGCGAAPAIR